ncbi:MAG: YihY/virulence factor BrkB family protein [Mucilaginibacter polytrichastri]|nr:YihY/virulence factor BrkB family protein [Mucilaginibacter polytrichastri]
MSAISKHSIKEYGQMIATAGGNFMTDRCLKLSAALAYYTLFSIAPLLVIVIAVATIFYSREAINGRLSEEISEFVGGSAAEQIQSLIEKSSIGGGSFFALSVSIVVLILGATSVFIEIQDSINMIWRVRAKPKKGWKQMLINRGLSLSVIATLGFLLIASLLINVFISGLSSWLVRHLGDVMYVVVYLINLTITFIVISVLFGTIFKVLPDVDIEWKTVRTGAFFTAILFIIGKFVIGIYIDKTATGSAYGAAGSIIVILTWIYYTAAILYFGAEFTQVYAIKHGGHIQPAKYAVYLEQHEVERDKATNMPVDKSSQITQAPSAD